MSELFHPDVPGQSTRSRGFRRAGWREWDDLTEQEQAAHEKAVKAAERAVDKQRADAREARDEARAASTQTATDKRSASEPASKAAPRRKKSTDNAPTTGDTTKE